MENQIQFITRQDNKQKLCNKIGIFIFIGIILFFTLILMGVIYLKDYGQNQASSKDLPQTQMAEKNIQENSDIENQSNSIIIEKNEIISPELDSDNDGVTDLEEINQGLNPRINEVELAKNADLSSCDKDKGVIASVTVKGSAIGSKDVDLEGMSLYDACLINVAERLDNVYVCEKISSSHSMYGLCYATFAEKRANLQLCQKIPNNNGHKSRCYHGVAVAISNVMICNKIETVDALRAFRKHEETTQCYQAVAIKKNEPAFCDSMNDNDSKATCYAYFGIKNKKIELCLKAKEFKEGVKAADWCFDALARTQLNESYCDYMSSADKNKYFPEGRCRRSISDIKAGKMYCYTSKAIFDPNFMRPEEGVSCKTNQ